MAYFIGYHPSVEHPDTSGYFRVDQMSQGSTQPGDTAERVFLTVSEPQFSAVRAAQKWEDGFGCLAYIRPSPPGVLSHPDDRVLTRFRYDGSEVEDLTLDEGDSTAPVLQVEAIDDVGAIRTGLTLGYDLDISSGLKLRVDIISGVAVIDYETDSPGTIDITSTDIYRVMPDGRFTLTIRQTVLRPPLMG